MTNFPESIGVFGYSPACFLRASGPDAEAFLQGQFSNDLRQAANGQPVYGLWLDRRGRVLADSHVGVAPGGGFWIASLSTPAAVIARHLEDHIIADEVSVEDLTPGWRGFSVVGAGSGGWLRAADRAGCLFPGRRCADENWEWFFPQGDGGLVEAALAGARKMTHDEMARMRIAAGIPSIPDDIGPGDLPNEGGLEAVAVSYSKGCYLGQEVMARLRTRGRVRRRLARAAGRGPAPALPAALWRDGKRDGELRSVAPTADGSGYVGLALVSADGAGRSLSLAQAGAAEVGISPI